MQPGFRGAAEKGMASRGKPQRLELEVGNLTVGRLELPFSWVRVLPLKIPMKLRSEDASSRHVRLNPGHLGS
jgi:hypothetical protein